MGLMWHLAMSKAFQRCSIIQHERAVTLFCMLQSYRRMKADSEWEILQSKLAGEEPGYQASHHPSHAMPDPSKPKCEVPSLTMLANLSACSTHTCYNAHRIIYFRM